MLALPPTQRCIKELCSFRGAPSELLLLSAREPLGTGESSSTLPKALTCIQEAGEQGSARNPLGYLRSWENCAGEEVPCSHGALLGTADSPGRACPAGLGSAITTSSPQAGQHGAACGSGGCGCQRAGSHQVLRGRRAGAHLLRAERGHRGSLALHGEWLWLLGFRAGWGNLCPQGWEAASHVPAPTCSALMAARGRALLVQYRFSSPLPYPGDSLVVPWLAEPSPL